MGLALDSLTIVPANLAQLRLSRELTWLEWNRGRTVQEYLDEYAGTESCNFATDSKFTTWVLVPRSDPETQEFLSSCETFRRKVVLNSTSESVRTGIGYGIASVFTRPAFRRKGYARHMMHLLHHVLAAPESLPPFPSVWGAPPERRTLIEAAMVSVLYSDVGHFYASCGPDLTGPGWTTTKQSATIWPVDIDTPALPELEENLQWLDETSLANVLQTDDKLIFSEISADTPTSSSTRWSFLPGDGQMNFQVKRFTLSPGWVAAAGLISATPIFGAAIHGGGPISFAAWTFEMQPQPSRLIIGRIRASKNTFDHLIGAAMHVAREVNVKQVEVWNLPGELEAAAKELGGYTVTRDDHWPCMAWYGTGTPEWINNEKFCWC